MTSDKFSNVPPLIGRMPTPLTVSKMISLDRNFSKDIWVPTNRSLHEMCSRFNASPSRQISTDVRRGKFYQKLARNKKKQENKNSMMQNLQKKLVGDVSQLEAKIKHLETKI
jgi:hypothetical protein